VKCERNQFKKFSGKYSWDRQVLSVEWWWWRSDGW